MSLGKLLSIIYRVRLKELRSMLEEYEIGNSEYPILLILDNKNGLSQNLLAKEGGFNKSIMAKGVKKLETLGYIEVKKEEENKQKKYVYLTKRGEKLVPKIRSKIIEWEEQKLLNFSEKEKKELEKLLQKLYYNVSNER